MWMIDKPAKPAEIAKDTGVNFKQAWMHLLGLTKMEYVNSPEKGFYVITEKGKKTLGIPEVDKQKAAEIVTYLPMEKSFHFYADIGKPLDAFATSLGDFSEKIQKVDLGSIEFHIRRGDFEAWFTSLGDIELARKTLLAREQKMSGEELRKKLHEIIRKRFEELAKIRNG
jgi:DNA-binding PadR family transcriptional regulator